MPKRFVKKSTARICEGQLFRIQATLCLACSCLIELTITESGRRSERLQYRGVLVQIFSSQAAWSRFLLRPPAGQSAVSFRWRRLAHRTPPTTAAGGISPNHTSPPNLGNSLTYPVDRRHQSRGPASSGQGRRWLAPLRAFRRRVRPGTQGDTRTSHRGGPGPGGSDMVSADRGRGHPGTLQLAGG